MIRLSSDRSSSGRDFHHRVPRLMCGRTCQRQGQVGGSPIRPAALDVTREFAGIKYPPVLDLPLPYCGQVIAPRRGLSPGEPFELAGGIWRAFQGAMVPRRPLKLPVPRPFRTKRAPPLLLVRASGPPSLASPHPVRGRSAPDHPIPCGTEGLLQRPSRAPRLPPPRS